MPIPRSILGAVRHAFEGATQQLQRPTHQAVFRALSASLVDDDGGAHYARKLRRTDGFEKEITRLSTNLRDSEVTRVKLLGAGQIADAEELRQNSYGIRASLDLAERVYQESNDVKNILFGNLLTQIAIKIDKRAIALDADKIADAEELRVEISDLVNRLEAMEFKYGEDLLLIKRARDHVDWCQESFADLGQDDTDTHRVAVEHGYEVALEKYRSLVESVRSKISVLEGLDTVPTRLGIQTLLRKPLLSDTELNYATKLFKEIDARVPERRWVSIEGGDVTEKLTGQAPRILSKYEIALITTNAQNHGGYDAVLKDFGRLMKENKLAFTSYNSLRLAIHDEKLFDPSNFSAS